MTDLKNIKFPQDTPKWSIGLTIFFVSSLTVLISLYIAMKPEIQVYLGIQDKKIQSLTREQKEQRKETDKRLDLILTLIDNNDKQILLLSRTLGESEVSRKELEHRIHILEIDLKNCKYKLKKYIKNEIKNENKLFNP